MTTLRLSATIGRDRRLSLTLPDDIEPGEVELVIRTLNDDDAADATAKVTLQNTNLATETARAKFLAAGKLAQTAPAPDDFKLVASQKLLEIGSKLTGKGKTLDDVLDDERGAQ